MYRRTILATGLAAFTGSLSGCIGGIFPEPAEDPNPTVRYELTQGINADVRDVSAESSTRIRVEMAVSVPQRGEYWIRVSGIEDSVSIGDSIATQILYPSDWQQVDIRVSADPKSVQELLVQIEPYTNQPIR